MAAPVQQHRQRQQGFSLLEIVLSIVLLGILGVAGTHMIVGSFFTTQVIGNEHLANSMARYAMERMVRDVREISYNTSSDVVGITSMSASQLSFTKSGPGSTSTSVGFAYANPTLTMTVAGTSATLATAITGFGFSYLDANGLDTAIPNAVRSVRITLTATPAQAQAITLTTQVRLRNV